MSKLNYQTLREKVASILRQRILDGTIRTGERIKELDVSREFEISRGPVREALRQLEQEGLVHYEPNRGCTVVTMSYESVREMYLIRSTLETLAVRIFDGKFSEETLQQMELCVKEMEEASKKRELSAIVSSDEKFHEQIVKEAGKELLRKTWKSFEGGNAAVYYTMNRDNNELRPVDYVARNHARLLETCRTGDCEEICREIEQHYMVVPESLRSRNNVGNIAGITARTEADKEAGITARTEAENEAGSTAGNGTESAARDGTGNIILNDAAVAAERSVVAKASGS